VLGNKLDDVDDVATLRLMVTQLWGILDDIDIASELCDDNAQYRSVVEMVHQKRYNTGLTSSGFTIFYDANDVK